MKTEEIREALTPVLSVALPDKKVKFADCCESREFCEKPTITRVSGCELFANSLRICCESQEKNSFRLKFAIVSHCRDNK